MGMGVGVGLLSDLFFYLFLIFYVVFSFWDICMQ